MEQIFWVRNGELGEVNKWLQKGGRVKMIQAVGEPIAAYGCGGGRVDWNDHGSEVSDIYAYIVVEFD